MPRSYQVTPDIPDRRRATQQKEVRPDPGRQPQRESARRPVGTFSSASDVTDAPNPNSKPRSSSDGGRFYAREPVRPGARSQTPAAANSTLRIAVMTLRAIPKSPQPRPVPAVVDDEEQRDPPPTGRPGLEAPTTARSTARRVGHRRRRSRAVPRRPCTRSPASGFACRRHPRQRSAAIASASKRQSVRRLPGLGASSVTRTRRLRGGSPANPHAAPSPAHGVVTCPPEQNGRAW